MADEVHVWEITRDDRLAEIQRSKLDEEKRIENWIERDISVLDPDLLVIGRQVPTAYGKLVDLLCIDPAGSLVIVELKRDKTPREVTAQAIDYASWVKDLELDQIREIATNYFEGKGNGLTLESAFSAKFDAEFPEKVNERHAMRIVAADIDESTERIIRYLSEDYGVDINAIKFQFFAANSHEFLVRTFTVDPEEVEKNTKKGSGHRNPNKSQEDLERIAEENGVGDLYRQFKEAGASYFGKGVPMVTGLSFYGSFPDKSKKAVWRLVPEESSSDEGLRYQVYTERLCELTHTDQTLLREHLPANPETWEPWAGVTGLRGYVTSQDEIHAIATFLREHMREATEAA